MVKKDMAKKDKAKSKTPKPPTVAVETAAGDDAEAARRVAFLRHKLSKAMDDPLTRDQIVNAIRSMMGEEK